MSTVPIEAACAARPKAKFGQQCLDIFLGAPLQFVNSIHICASLGSGPLGAYGVLGLSGGLRFAGRAVGSVDMDCKPERSHFKAGVYTILNSFFLDSLSHIGGGL